MHVKRLSKLALIALILLALSSCNVLFPSTTAQMDTLPSDFWVNVSDLGWALGSDVWGWISFLLDIAL